MYQDGTGFEDDAVVQGVFLLTVGRSRTSTCVYVTAKSFHSLGRDPSHKDCDDVDTTLYIPLRDPQGSEAATASLTRVTSVQIERNWSLFMYLTFTSMIKAIRMRPRLVVGGRLFRGLGNDVQWTFWLHSMTQDVHQSLNRNAVS